MTPYLFTSARLGFRDWQPTDLPKMAAINADHEVMHYFPSVQSEQDTQAFINRMQLQLSNKGFCYFAVDRLADGAFIGFIGLSEQTFEADFTPCIDMGWRLDKAYWHQGYATEGALRCLSFAFDTLKLKEVNAVAPLANTPSIHVMEKAGMQKIQTFMHPALTQHAWLQQCARYLVTQQQYTGNH